MANPSPLHNTVCGMPGHNFTINGNGDIGYRTIPDIMIPLAMSHDGATMLG
jgi:hypothetical protein